LQPAEPHNSPTDALLPPCPPSHPTAQLNRHPSNIHPPPVNPGQWPFGPVPKLSQTLTPVLERHAAATQRSHRHARGIITGERQHRARRADVTRGGGGYHQHSGGRHGLRHRPAAATVRHRVRAHARGARRPTLCPFYLAPSLVATFALTAGSGMRYDSRAVGRWYTVRKRPHPAATSGRPRWLLRVGFEETATRRQRDWILKCLLSGRAHPLAAYRVATLCCVPPHPQKNGERSHPTCRRPLTLAPRPSPGGVELSTSVRGCAHRRGVPEEPAAGGDQRAVHASHRRQSGAAHGGGRGRGWVTP
jgi:hypothetical protein